MSETKKEKSLAEKIIESIPDDLWDQMENDNEAIYEIIDTLIDLGIGFETMARIAQKNIELLADYAEEPDLFDIADLTIDRLVFRCKEEEKRVLTNEEEE